MAERFADVMVTSPVQSAAGDSQLAHPHVPRLNMQNHDPPDSEPSPSAAPSGEGLRAGKTGEVRAAKKDDLSRIRPVFFGENAADHKQAIHKRFPINKHPDSVLRSLGLIEQFGTVKVYGMNKPIYYNSCTDTWRFVDTTLDDRQLENIKEASIASRHDVVPNSCVLILGSLSDYVDEEVTRLRTQAVLESRPGSEPQRKPDSAKPAVNIRKPSVKPTPASLFDIAKELSKKHTLDAKIRQESYLTEEMSTVIRQYFIGPIPRVCFETGTLMIGLAGNFVDELLDQAKAGMENEDSKAGKLSILSLHAEAFRRYRKPDEESALAEDSNIPLPANAKKTFTHHVSLVPSGGEAGVVTERDVHVFAERLTAELSKGSHKAVVNGRRVPRRQPSCACAIVVGGHRHVLRYQLMACVTNRWPIIVFEGTGGYSDVLCYVIKRVRMLSAPQVADIDEYRQFLGSIDPLTAEIINRGRVHVVKIGTTPTQLSELLHRVIVGDEILHEAWVTCATWREHGIAQEKLYHRFQLAIIMIGILATFVAVIMTYLLIIWNNVQPKDQTPRRQWIVVVWYINQALVIGLPIISSLVQAIMSRFKFGAKWVFLISASEELLTEIFNYRTRTNGYNEYDIHQNLVKIQSQKKKGAPNDNIEIYYSPEQLLQKRLSALTKTLMETCVQGITLTKYAGPLPPPDMVSEGDDGFSLLSPEDYMKYRLKPKYNSYKNEASSFAVLRTGFGCTIHFANTAGTLLAALAAYDYGALQAWIAFTTCIVNSLTRYLDYSCIEWCVQKKNKSHMLLGLTQSWWVGVGCSRDDRQTRNQLVTFCEGVINEEVSSWGQQLQKALAKEKKAMEEMNDELKRTLESTEGYKAALREFGLEALDVENIKGVILNPTEESLTALRGTIARISQKIGDTPADIVKKIDDGVTTVTQALGGAGVIETAKDLVATTKTIKARIQELKQSGLKISEMIPMAALMVLKDQSIRNKFFSVSTAVVQPVFSHFQLMDMAQRVGGDVLRVAGESQRSLLEISKQLGMEELAAVVLDTTEPVLGVDLALWKSAAEMLRSTKPEDLISELVSIASDESAMTACADMMLKLFKEGQIKKTLEGVAGLTYEQSYGVMKLLLDRASRKYIHNTTNPGVRLVLQTMKDIAALDIDELERTQDDLLREALANISSLCEVHIDMMPKQQLLALFPIGIQAVIASKSQQQIAKYVDHLKHGTTATRIFQSMLESFDYSPQFLTESQMEWKDSVNILTTQSGVATDWSYREAEGLVLCVGTLKQAYVNQLSKANLIRVIRTRKLTEKLEDILSHLPDENAHRVVGRVLGLASSTYAGVLVHAISDNMESVDITEMLPKEAYEKFVDKLACFVGRDPDTLTKEQILTAFGFPDLIQTLAELDQLQLREILKHYMVVQSHSLLLRAVGNLLKNDEDLQKTIQKNERTLHELLVNTGVLERLVFILDTRMFIKLRYLMHGSNYKQTYYVMGRKQKVSPEAYFLSYIGDRLIWQVFENYSLFSLESLFSKLLRCIGERVTLSIFDFVSVSLSEGEIYERFAALFCVPEHRLAMVDALIPLIPCVRSSLGSSIPNDRDVTTLFKLPLADMVVSDQPPQRLILPPFLRDSFPNPEAQKYIVLTLFSELVSTAPTRIFLAVADAIVDFDLRNLVEFRGARRQFVHLVYAMLAGRLVQWESTISPRERNQLRSSDCAIISVTADRKSIISVLTGSKVQREVVQVFRDFKEDQLKYCMAMIYTLIETTRVGMAYKKYMEALGAKELDSLWAIVVPLTDLEPPSQGEWKLGEAQEVEITMRAVECLRNKLRINYQSVFSDLCGMDAAVFCSRDVKEQRRILTQYLEDDRLSGAVLEHFSQRDYPALRKKLGMERLFLMTGRSFVSGDTMHSPNDGKLKAVGQVFEFLHRLRAPLRVSSNAARPQEPKVDTDLASDPEYSDEEPN